MFSFALAVSARAFHVGSLETETYSSSATSSAGRKIFQRDTVPLSLALRLLRRGPQEIGIFPGILYWEDKTSVLVPALGVGSMGQCLFPGRGFHTVLEACQITLRTTETLVDGTSP